jgi:putative FmdB family regulatory protein
MMPLFEFRCTECSAEFEKLVRHAGKYEEISCPECRSGKVEEILSTFASPAKSAPHGSHFGACKPAGG